MMFTFPIDDYHTKKRALPELTFQRTLEKLANPHVNISVENDFLVLSTCKSAETSPVKEKFKAIKKYIKDPYCDKKDLKNISKIKERLLQESKDDERLKAKTEKVFDNIVKQLESNNHYAYRKKTEVLHQVASTPDNAQEFAANLQLFLNFFPRYILGNALEVYDTSLSGVPQNWKRESVIKKLEEDFARLTSGNDVDDIENLKALKNEVRQLLRPATIVKIGIINETGGEENCAMFTDAKNMVLGDLPLVANRNLFIVHHARFSKNSFFKAQQLYLQKSGGLCLMISNDKTPEDYGFDSNELEKWIGTYADIPKSAMNFSKDIASISLKDSEDTKFFRLFTLNGHGMYPEKAYHPSKTAEGSLAGFKTREFQKVLEALIELNMVFCLLESCYACGIIADDIRLLKLGTMPCGMLVNSALERSSFSGTFFHHLLNAAEEQLFPEDWPLSSVFPKQFTRLGLCKIAKVLPTNSKVFNLTSCFLPTTRGDVPRTPQTLLTDEANVLDVSKETKRHAAKNQSDIIYDPELNRKAYLFSDPIFPFVLHL